MPHRAARLNIDPMSVWTRIADYLGFATRSHTPEHGSAAVPPPRSSLATVDRALSLSTVYRAIEILANAAAQLTIHVYRGDERLPDNEVASIIRKPTVTGGSQRAFLKQTVMSLAAHGDAYWRKVYGPSGTIVELQILPAEHVEPIKNLAGVIEYHHDGRRYPRSEILHMQLGRRAGRLKGLGPIQACRIELTGALDARDYGSTWFREAGVPNGILTTDQQLSPDIAKVIKDNWHRRDPETGEPLEDKLHEVRVIGNGTHYEPLLIKPADAQFLETQQFTTTQIARLFGIPASLMLAVVEGNSQSYANVEQDWIAFIRFTLMGYVSEMEDALNELVPHTQRVRFNVDALLRTDTLTRYQAHTLALGRWMTVDEIRDIENRPPLTAAQRAALTATTATEPANA